MAINLDNVKAITHNNKDVVKIEDSQGRIIWQLPSTSETLYYSYESGATVLQKKLENDTFSNVTWGITHPVEGNNIWSDGDHIYYSKGSNHYVLNESDMTWSQNTWTGLTSFDGNYVWTDGTDIYYSTTSNQYVLNKATSTWSTTTWTGVSNLGGNNIWYLSVDGHSYTIFSNSGSQYYRRTNSPDTWNTFNWSATGSAITSFSGYNVWTDGTNTYLSQGGKTYVATYASGAKWVEITVNGTTLITGGRIFKYNGELYGIENGSPYQMYKLTSADRTQITWTRFDFTDQPAAQAAFRGDMFWNENGRSSALAVMYTKK